MYSIKKCSETADAQTYQAFSKGFSDYMIKMNMDEDTFISHFFGPEGNHRELSFVAFKDGEPVGVTLGGLKTDESFKTLRCGGMAVVPNERGTGLAKELMDLHESLAQQQGCRQLFLEVINGNDRAIRFYSKRGYEKVYDLTYREWILAGYGQPEEDKLQHKVEEIAFEDIQTLRAMDHSHLPWQGSFVYFSQLSCHYYGIREHSKIVAGVVVGRTRVFYLYVHPEFRQRGYAKALLNKVIADLQPETLRFTYANNHLIHTFANHLNMKMEPISQYEMYKWLG